MIWEEDPRVQEGIWRFFGGSIVLLTALVVIGGIVDRDMEFVFSYLYGLLMVALSFWVAGLVGGLILRGLFSLGDMWRWLRACLRSRSRH